MASQIGQGVTLLGLEVSSDAVTVNLASGITEKDEGKALAVDASAPNTMKLAEDGDAIRGYLDKVEIREAEGVVVGTVYTRGWFKFPLKASDAAAIGDSIVGAGSGEVKKAMADAAAVVNETYIVEKGSDYVVARIAA